MTVKERLLTLKLIEKQKKNSDFLKELGLNIEIIKVKKEDKQHEQVCSNLP